MSEDGFLQPIRTGINKDETEIFGIHEVKRENRLIDLERSNSYREIVDTTRKIDIPQRSGKTSFYEPPKFSGGPRQRRRIIFKKYERLALINNWNDPQKVCFFPIYVDKSASVLLLDSLELKYRVNITHG